MFGNDSDVVVTQPHYTRQTLLLCAATERATPILAAAGLCYGRAEQSSAQATTAAAGLRCGRAEQSSAQATAAAGLCCGRVEQSSAQATAAAGLCCARAEQSSAQATTTAAAGLRCGRAEQSSAQATASVQLNGAYASLRRHKVIHFNVVISNFVKFNFNSWSSRVC